MFGKTVPHYAIGSIQPCPVCRVAMEIYKVGEEDNVCPVCNSYLSVLRGHMQFTEKEAEEMYQKAGLNKMQVEEGEDVKEEPSKKEKSQMNNTKVTQITNQDWTEALRASIGKSEEKKKNQASLSEKVFSKLTGNVFGILLLIWAGSLAVGNFDMLVHPEVMSQDKIYIANCVEREDDAFGSTCIEYGEGEYISVRENFIRSLWTSSFITAGAGLLVLFKAIFTEARYRLWKLRNH